MSSEHYEQLGRATEEFQKAEKRAVAARERMQELGDALAEFKNVNIGTLRVNDGRLTQQTQAVRGRNVSTQEVDRYPSYEELVEAVQERDAASRAVLAARSALAASTE